MEKTNDIKDKRLIQALQNNTVLMEIVKTLTHESKTLTNCFSNLFSELSDKNILSSNQLVAIGQCLEEVSKSQKLTMELMEMVKFDNEEGDSDVTVTN